MPSSVAQIEFPELNVTLDDERNALLETILQQGATEGLWDTYNRLRIIATVRGRQLLDALTQLSALREASEWVSVTHRLPASGEKIWVARIIKATESIPAHYVVRDATYNPVHAFPYSGDGPSVHFWMPRQDPPLPPQPASAGKEPK